MHLITGIFRCNLYRSLFRSLIEGVDGYSLSITITLALLVKLGFNSLSVVLIALIANTIIMLFANLDVLLLTLSLF
ncbi:MAG TPA: hypothetical protein EYH40_02045 [Desulfurococcales archaeon]|nr:hypothetical protein [Desulfurococcales archaeon]